MTSRNMVQDAEALEHATQYTGTRLRAGELTATESELLNNCKSKLSYTYMGVAFATGFGSYMVLPKRFSKPMRILVAGFSSIAFSQIATSFVRQKCLFDFMQLPGSKIAQQSRAIIRSRSPNHFLLEEFRKKHPSLDDTEKSEYPTIMEQVKKNMQAPAITNPSVAPQPATQPLLQHQAQIPQQGSESLDHGRVDVSDTSDAQVNLSETSASSDDTLTSQYLNDSTPLLGEGTRFGSPDRWDAVITNSRDEHDRGQGGWFAGTSSDWRANETNKGSTWDPDSEPDPYPSDVRSWDDVRRDAEAPAIQHRTWDDIRNENQ